MLLEHSIVVKLHDYQQEVRSQLYQNIRAGIKRNLIVAQTGTGKTVMAGAICEDVCCKGARAIFLVHLTTLVSQTVTRFLAHEKIGTITQYYADKIYDPDASVVVASIQTVTARYKKYGEQLRDIIGPISVIFADEAHVSSYHAGFQAMLELYPDACVIGLTATPWRTSKKEYLGQFYDAVVEAPQPPELIRMGKSVPARIFGFDKKVFDLSKVAIQQGDYSASGLSRQLTNEKLVFVLDQWLRVCPFAPTIAFFPKVEDAQKFADVCNARNIPTEFVVAETKNREDIYKRLETGQTKILSSVGVLTAGFDCPPVSSVIFCRATKSKSLFFQCAGRANRSYPGKEFYYLLDFGQNFPDRFNDPSGPQNYDIGEKKYTDNPAPTKQCPECDCFVHLSARECPECGYQFPPPKPKTYEQIEAEFTELFDKEHRKKIKFIRNAIKSNFENNITPDAAQAAFRQKFGHVCPKEWMLHAALGPLPSESKINKYLKYLNSHCMKNAYENKWFQYHKENELGSTISVQGSLL